MKKLDKAFTLVELIVVITILAILGTIAFISIQGYSADARDGKRISDIRSIKTKIEIEANLKKVHPIGSYLSGELLDNTLADNSGVVFAGATSIVKGTNYGVGEINFNLLRESEEDYLDPITNKSYVFGYVSGDNMNMYQLAGNLEKDNTALVDGNYFKMGNTDLVGLIKSVTDSTKIVENKKEFLPY